MRTTVPHLLLAFVAVALLGGCAAGVAGLALSGASLLGSLVSDGGDRPPRIDFNPNRDLSETLAGADHRVNAACRARLDALRQRLPLEPPPPGECISQPACLGGLDNPMQVMVCADPPREAPAMAAQDAGTSVPWAWDATPEAAAGTGSE